MEEIKTSKGIMLFHFIGPGGAGKTTIAKLLSARMGFESHDLDEYFIQIAGDISNYIECYGYEAYALRNINLYKKLKKTFKPKQHIILACSSGFMTYPEAITPEYAKLLQEIENDPFTFLLIPSLNLDECIEILVARQLTRSYLNISVEKEEIKVRKRFETYLNLNCQKVFTNQAVDAIVDEIQGLIVNYR